MFRFFKRRPAPDPSTQRQLNYARKLGVTVTAGMSKAELSDAISAAETKNPGAKRQRQDINRKRQARADAQWAAECGPDLMEAEKKWQKLSEGEGYILAAYAKGKSTIVDVLRVNDAYIDEKKTLRLGVESPKLRKDRYIGDYLEWDREFELAIHKLLYYEMLPGDFAEMGLPAYKDAVERGLQIAQRL